MTGASHIAIFRQGRRGLISRTDAAVPVTVQTRANVGPDWAFDAIVPIDPCLIFTGWGPFPGVRCVMQQTIAWDHAGASRNPVFTDGSTAKETLTEYTAGSSFACELTDFTNALRRITTGVRGEWTFTPDNGGTVIRCTSEFKPRTGRRLLLRLGLAPLWRRYMQAAIEAAAKVAEQPVKPTANPLGCATDPESNGRSPLPPAYLRPR